MTQSDKGDSPRRRVRHSASISTIRGPLYLEGCQVENEADDEPTHLTTDGDVSPPSVALTLCGKRMVECGWGEALLIVQWVRYGVCQECVRVLRQLVDVLEDE